MTVTAKQPTAAESLAPSYAQGLGDGGGGATVGRFALPGGLAA